MLGSKGKEPAGFQTTNGLMSSFFPNVLLAVTGLSKLKKTGRYKRSKQNKKYQG